MPEPSLTGNDGPRARARERAVRLFCFLVAAGLLGLAFACDSAAVSLVREQANGWGRWLAGRVSYWGDWYGILALGVSIWLIGKRPQFAFLRKLALLMGLCASIAGLSANGIRAMTGRARPFAQAAPGWFGPREGMRLWARGARDYQSFPSAHTSVVAGFLAPVALLSLGQRRRRLRVCGVGVAIGGTALMGWARVWAGAHHVSDVVAASLLGVLVGWAVLRSPRISRRFTFPAPPH